MKFTLRVLLILAALTAPVAAKQRLRAQVLQSMQQQNPVMVNGALSESDANAGEEAMVETIVPANVSTPATPSSRPSRAARPAAAPSPTAKPILPITALLYSSSPGPKECRGTPIMRLDIPKGPGLETPKGPTCYNIPGANRVAQCGTFMANLDDGCQARLFSDPNCTNFANIGVFIEELRPMGGVFRSMEVTCGVVNAQPAPLNLNLPKVQKPAKAGR
jgi:hypothetical protein